MKKLLFALLPVFISTASASPLPAKADVLAANTVVAEYIGTQHIPCRFMTVDCPDRCDHASDVAQFRVISNEKYVCNSEYGDEKEGPGSVMLVEARKAVPGQDDAAVHKLLGELKPGDKVRMTVTHYYVEHNGVQEPVRPVTEIARD